MNPQVLRLDEAALARLGFDRVLIAALRNMARVTGAESNGPTVPEIIQQSGEVERLVGVLREQVVTIQSVIDIIELSPEPQSPDLSGIAALSVQPPAPFVQPLEHITTEVRQIAEQVATLSRQIQDIKQGTML